MCKIELLKTKPKRIKSIDRRTVEEIPSYLQIQYYNDCIRALATKRNLHIDASLHLIEANNLLPVMEDAYKQKKKVFVAVRRMQRQWKRYDTLSWD